jgi:hypothetical protein
MPKGKEIPKRVSAVIKEGSTRIMLMNNQQHIIHTYYIHCSDCGRVVYSIDSSPLNLADSVKSLVPQMLESATYCPKCGRKLEYVLPDVVEAEYVELNKTYPDMPPQPQVEPEVKPVEEQSSEQQENKEKQ